MLGLPSEYQHILGYSVRPCIEGGQRRGEKERRGDEEGSADGDWMCGEGKGKRLGVRKEIGSGMWHL